MKRFFLIVLLFTAGISYSAYLNFVPVSVTQPNGAVLNIYASGDEFYNWLHDKDGYTIIQNENTGYYCYAVQDGSKLTASAYVAGISSPFLLGFKPWLMIPESEIYAKRNEFYRTLYKDKYAAPKTGTINNLVVFIRFAGENEFTDSLSIYKKMFNNETPNTNSMYNYFKECSYNQLFAKTHFFPNLNNYIVTSFQDTGVRAYYKPYNAVTNPLGYTSSNATQREHSLLKRASEYVANMVPDTLNLDGDNDGKVDNVCFIVYGSSTAWADLLWPHMWSLYSMNAYIRGKRVYTYNFQLQVSLQSSGVGVLCHEMSHSLGAPDLYHYTNNNIDPMYYWDLMCSNANPPQHLCSYMKMKYLTWIPPIPVISAPGTYTMKYLLSSTNNSYKILSPYSSTEFYVVEFRRKLSIFENSAPGDGLIVLRINSNATGNANGPPDEVYIYRPGGTLSNNGYCYMANFCTEVGRTQINRSTNPTPFLSTGIQGGLNITNVGSYLDSIITFTLGEPTSVGGTVTPLTSELEQNYPNPFNPSTNIVYSVSKKGFVSMKVFDIAGREVSTLVNDVREPGKYSVMYDASALPSGVYFCRFTAGAYSSMKKMMLVK